MRGWALGALGLLLVLVSGCGGNTAAVGVTISGPGLSPLTILVDHPAPFAATVTGISTSTVFWQICEIPPVVSTTIPPTQCTAGQGPSTGCNITTATTPITGFGTITVNGLYTAPATVPQPATFYIVATSCVRANAFATFTVTISSGINVVVSPSIASIGPGENFQFSDTVTGTSNTAVVWLANNIPGGDAADGYICPSTAPGPAPGVPNPCDSGLAGEYFAPNVSSLTITVEAQSSADPQIEGSASVSIGTGGAPAFAASSPLDPSVAAEGSVQQDVYLSGTGFLSTTRVLLNGVAIPAASVTFISGTFLRATIPAAELTQAGTIEVSLQSQSGGLNSGDALLNVVPVRPAVIASSPDSLVQNNGGASLSVQLTGGYFVPNAKTTAAFNGLGCGVGLQVCTTFVDSRHLNVSINDSSLTTPGLYPLVVQNSDAATAGVPSITGLNLAITPLPSSIAGSPNPPIAVGSGPSAVAIDYADGIAVIANQTSGTVSLINLATNTLIGGAIAVGSQPTGVAVDDLLPSHFAYVVNSGDNTISVINLSLATPAVTQTLSLVSYEPTLIPLGTVPYSIGVDSLTHRAFIANQSTNVGTILDLANANTGLTPPCGMPPCPVSTVVGGITPYSTGPNPAVAIDPRLNWAMVTPGGAGTVAIVDLGRAPSSGDVGRIPELVGSLSLPATTTGVGINSETHQALLTDPDGTTLTTFNLLDDRVTTVVFTVNGQALSAPNYVAAAANPLENLGVAISGSKTGATAVVADLESGNVLQQVTGLGGTPQAVAVDPATSEAVIVNQGDGTVSMLSLGPLPASPQILEASPATTLTTTQATPLTLTGADFTPGSVVRLDQVPLPTPVASGCAVTCRQLTTTIPAGTLTSARRYLVDVVNPGGSLSNVTDLAVIQAIPVGNSPVGVAVDTDRDLAVVTNSADNTASLVSLTPPSTPLSPESLGPTGTVGSPISVGTAPEGVAVLPRLGMALVANNGSNDATVINITTANDITTAVPTEVALCGSTCTGPTGVAINQDTATGLITNTNSRAVSTTGSLSFLEMSPAATTLGGTTTLDQDPVAVAIDPLLNYAAVATASSTSSIEIVNTQAEFLASRITNGMENPSGVVFDPVNQVFLAANSLVNEVIIIDPVTLVPSFFNVGIEPTSLDYDFQTSSLVTLNSGSNTMSVLDYVCPPSTAAPSCSSPQVRAVIALGGEQTSSFVLGPNAVAIDPKLNLAVLLDPDNNRVLLVPLPH